jgi:hypothetical protein
MLLKAEAWHIDFALVLCGGVRLEAPSGIEPLHKGFADLSLTTWVRRPIRRSGRCDETWSGRRDSNPRHFAWEANALPLNYSRDALIIAPQAVFVNIVSAS